MSRKSKKVVMGVTREAYEEALAQYAKQDAEINKITADMDVKINAIREKHATQLQQLQEQKGDNFVIVQRYCEENESIFGNRKSIDTAFGVIGFRTCTPKLKLRKGFQWSVVTELLKSKLPSYVRTYDEPDKQMLLIDRNELNLAEVGVEVVQEEDFFITLKKEESNI